MAVDSALVAKVTEMLKKLGVSEDLMKELSDELSGSGSDEQKSEGGASVEVEIKKDVYFAFIKFSILSKNRSYMSKFISL